jgi:hypothetical protein
VGRTLSKKHRDSHFTEFRGHTELKHGVLRRYIAPWLQILKKSHAKLWIIDGFAGKGKDNAGNPGSPLLLARSAAQLRVDGVDVRLLAIEPRRDWYQALKHNLASFDAEEGGAAPVAYIRHGTLSEVQDEAFGLVGDAPVFLFLDPFGADGLELAIVRRTLALPKGEVFALFSHQSVCRHLAVLATEPRAERVRRIHSESLSLFPDLEADWLEQELTAATRSDAALLPTKQAAQRILEELFGTQSEADRILALSSTLWADEVTRAYLRALETCGATHITPLAIFDEEQRCSYYLVHAAKSYLARYKMKEAIAGATNKSDLPDASKRRIRWSHAARIDEIVATIVQRFAGEEVRWTSDGYSTGCVRVFALGETRMAYDQSKDLKVALDRYVIEKRPLRYRFPVRS